MVIENNLKNITVKDPIYNITAERITDLIIKTLPEDLKNYSKLFKIATFQNNINR